ncbi:MAG TPA: hypothetical protein VNO55_26910 [Polyangia bacterium]|nr:hypothetical protein [Polyangia bacterium]
MPNALRPLLSFFLTASIVLTAGCSSAPQAPNDADNTPGRGTVDGNPINGTDPDASADDGAASDATADAMTVVTDDAMAGAETAVVPDAAAAEITSPSPGDGGPSNVDTGPAPAACRKEPIYQGPVLSFSGGPNFGDGKGVGLCGFPNDKLPKGHFFGAVDTALFKDSQACGACVHVENADGTITADVQIIDLVDPVLSIGEKHVVTIDAAAHDRFSVTGNPDVKFHFVPCDVTGNVAVQFDATTTEGSSLLVMNHRTALADVQIQTSGGAWKKLMRTHFNRWNIPGKISGTANSLRFIDTSDRSVDAADVPFVALLQDVGVQLPGCP